MVLIRVLCVLHNDQGHLQPQADACCGYEARCLPVARLHSFKVPGQKHATHEESAGFRGSVPDALVNSHPLYASVCVRLPVT